MTTDQIGLWMIIGLAVGAVIVAVMAWWEIRDTWPELQPRRRYPRQ